MKLCSGIHLALSFAIVFVSCSQTSAVFRPKGTKEALECAELFKNNPSGCDRRGECLGQIEHNLELIGLNAEQIVSVFGKPDSIGPDIVPSIKTTHYLFSFFLDTRMGNLFLTGERLLDGWILNLKVILLFMWELLPIKADNNNV